MKKSASYKMANTTEKTKSELELLLEKNAYSGGLTATEKLKANKLIENPVYATKNCWVCKNEKAIYDTGLC